jgi:hypothetical protein
MEQREGTVFVGDGIGVFAATTVMNGAQSRFVRAASQP